MKPKKIFKIITGAVVFITLPSLLLFGFVYFKYNEDLPTGIQGKEADALALKMLEALNYEAYKNTNVIEWTFKKRHHYKWNKAQKKCDVYWKEYKVTLDLNAPNNNKAYIHGFKIEGDLAEELTEKATTYFNNDSFWLVAPYKVFDAGTKRSLVSLKNNEKALLITYTTGGSTPGDSYLWHLEPSGKPKSFQIWASILPIGGLNATWSDWTTTETEAMLPTFHKMLILGLEITHIKTER